MWTGTRPPRYPLPPRRVVPSRRPQCGQQLVPYSRHRLARAFRTLTINLERRSGHPQAPPRPWPPPNASRSIPPSRYSWRWGSVRVAGCEAYWTSGTPLCPDRRQLFSMPREQSNELRTGEKEGRPKLQKPVRSRASDEGGHAREKRGSHTRENRHSPYKRPI